MSTKVAKKTEETQTGKMRVVAYLNPKIGRRLKREKAETDKSLSLIIEEALAKQLKHRRALVTTT